MKHFEQSVPLTIQEKIKSVAIDFMKNIDNVHLDVLDPSLSEISGVSYSGFIPFQNGGYEVSALYYPYSSGVYLSDNEEQSTAEYLETLREMFEGEHGNLTAQNKERFFDFKNESIDPSLLRFEIWSEDDEIFVRLSHNYKDTPYYRGNYDDTLKEKTFSHKEFMESENIAKLFYTIKS